MTNENSAQTSLKEHIRQDLTAAMKSKDKATTSALRMLLAAIQAEETSTGTRTELTDEDVLKVIAREIKSVANPQRFTATMGAMSLPTLNSLKSKSSKNISHSSWMIPSLPS